MRVAVLALLLLVPAAAQDDKDGQNPIDRTLEKLWADKGIAPAARSDDAEFLRRVTLDLTGHIPTVEEARAFLAKPDRPKKIAELLKSDAFLDFWSTRLTNAMIGYQRDFEYMTNRAGFQEWIREQLASDRGWDQIVSDVLTATGEPRKRPQASFLSQFLEFQDERKYGIKVEDLTGKIATTFLGVRLRCAQCHDHPFDKYTQGDFYGMVAFFKKTGAQGAAGGDLGQTFAVKTFRQPLEYKFEHWPNPLEPQFLDGPPPETENLRVEFTEVLTRHDQFARAFVNRVWAYMFGRGVVDPYDDFSPRNRPVAPEMLEEMLAQARANKYSVRWLVGTIAASNAYQRSSRATPGQDAAAQEKHFARSRLRPLTPEQMWNAIDRASDLQGCAQGGIDSTALRRMGGVYQGGSNTTYDMLRNWFLRMLVRTANPDAPSSLGQYTANVQQVLYAMNAESPLWSGASPKGEGRLARLIRNFTSMRGLIDEIFVASLGRPPTKAEYDGMREHVKKAELAGEQRTAKEKEALVFDACRDIFWAILNSDEFIFNH